MKLRRPTPPPLVLLAIPPPAWGADQGIAPGGKAGGGDVGGQTVEVATANLQNALGPQYGRPVDVVVGARTFRLQPTDAKLVFDAATTAKRAYYAGRDKGPGQEVPVALTFSVKSLRAWA